MAQLRKPILGPVEQRAMIRQVRLRLPPEFFEREIGRFVRENSESTRQFGPPLRLDARGRLAAVSKPPVDEEGPENSVPILDKVSRGRGGAGRFSSHVVSEVGREHVVDVQEFVTGPVFEGGTIEQSRRGNRDDDRVFFRRSE
ncbi:MAG: hypothetical protein B6D36_19205 [Planctomycetes bacterium UTPLA1]|nr:MAG: hypothetical protein B6D36_19205 [Planctomycetes bacterium UTPLA1]